MKRNYCSHMMVFFFLPIRIENTSLVRAIYYTLMKVAELKLHMVCDGLVVPRHMPNIAVSVSRHGVGRSRFYPPGRSK